MSDYSSRQPFQNQSAGQGMGVRAGDTPPPMFSVPSNVASTTGHLVNNTDALVPIGTRSLAPRTDQLPSVGPLHDVSTTQSLISALQSTMAAPKRHPVVIPGQKKNTLTKEEMEALAQRRLHPHLRLGLVLGSMLFVIITTLVSLAPLGTGQSKYTIVGSAAQWVQAQQQNWSVNARVNQTVALQQDQPVDTGNTQGGTPPDVFLPKSKYVDIARQDAIDYGINPNYFVRQINQESGFDPRAVSPVGAVGIAQFMPATARGLGIDPWDPIQALRGAARMMSDSARQYGGDYAKALAAYNAGGGAVDRAVRLGGANWLSLMPYETQQYVRVIMG